MAPKTPAKNTMKKGKKEKKVKDPNAPKVCLFIKHCVALADKSCALLGGVRRWFGLWSTHCGGIVIGAIEVDTPS